jgi:predicted acyltransferase
MLLVNNPGQWGVAYGPLKHADWNGWTPTDLVFPFFLFIVGITTHLSQSRREAWDDQPGAIRRQVLRRGALLVLIGFLLNWFPFYQFGGIPGHALPTFVDRVVYRLHETRFLGVLQRIGIVYATVALLTWRTSTRRIVAVVIVLLVGYWLAMTLVPVPGTNTIGAHLLEDRSRNLAAWLDRLVLDWSRWGGGNHLWGGSLTYDPEGLLSTVPAIGTAMIGVLAGRWITSSRPLSQRIARLIAAGVVCVALGLLWNLSFPINKNLWTSSYVLFTAGLASITIGVILWVVDARQWHRWTKPLEVYGTNPIVAFVGSELMVVLIYSTIKVRVAGRLIPFQVWMYRSLLEPWLEPRAASVAYALCFVACWYGILLLLYRKRVFVRV